MSFTFDRSKEEGRIHLGFKNLSPQDLRRILEKLQSKSTCNNLASAALDRDADNTITAFDATTSAVAKGSNNPRDLDEMECARPLKRRRLEGIDAVLATLPPPVPVWYFNVVGNDSIGDAGTRMLTNMLPSTVVDLDVSNCGITTSGVRDICNFLKRNKTIIRMIMWKSHVGNAGCHHFKEMLTVNQTLRKLCLMRCNIGAEGFRLISAGLMQNNTLRDLDLANNGSCGDAYVKNLIPGLRLNSGLKRLDLEKNQISEKGVKLLVKCLRNNNMHLEHISLGQPDDEDEWFFIGSGTLWNELCEWLKLNQLNRKLIKKTLPGSDTSMEWHNAIFNSIKARNVNSTYFFIRNCPDVCYEK